MNNRITNGSKSGGGQAEGKLINTNKNSAALANQKTVYQGPAVILPGNVQVNKRNNNDSSFEER